MIELKRKTQTGAERAETPLNCAVSHGNEKHVFDTQEIKNANTAQIKPFQSIDGKSDYRAMFAAAYKFHEKHNPPEADETGEPGGYWWRVSEDMTQLAQKYNNNDFMNALLLAVFSELEREYNHIQAGKEAKQ